MKLKELRYWVAGASLAALPFFSGCSSFATAGIAVGLDRKSLSYKNAEEEIRNGANVRDSWAGKCFLKQATEQERWDLVILFLENGASPWEAPVSYDKKPFSLFKAITSGNLSIPENTRLELLEACLSRKDENPRVAEVQVSEYVSQILTRSQGSFERAALEKISAAGLAKSVLSQWSADRLAEEEAERAAQAEREREEAEDAKEAERARKEADEAERVRIAEEEAERKAQAERERKEAEARESREWAERVCKAIKARGSRRGSEKGVPVEDFLRKCVSGTSGLSEENRARGNALLDAFGNEKVPNLFARYEEARTAALETQANYGELLSTLQSENIDLAQNEVYKSFLENYHTVAQKYFSLRNLLIDAYSIHKIGVRSVDDLATWDKRFAAPASN